MLWLCCCYLRQPVVLRSTTEECSLSLCSSWKSVLLQPEWGMITVLVTLLKASRMIVIFNASHEDRFHNTPTHRKQFTCMMFLENHTQTCLSIIGLNNLWLLWSLNLWHKIDKRYLWKKNKKKTTFTVWNQSHFCPLIVWTLKIPNEQDKWWQWREAKSLSVSSGEKKNLGRNQVHLERPDIAISDTVTLHVCWTTGDQQRIVQYYTLNSNITSKLAQMEIWTINYYWLLL